MSEETDDTITQLRKQVRDLEDRLQESRATRRFREKVRRRSHRATVDAMAAKLCEHAASARAKRHELYVALKRAEEERQAMIDLMVWAETALRDHTEPRAVADALEEGLP